MTSKFHRDRGRSEGRSDARVAAADARHNGSRTGSMRATLPMLAVAIAAAVALMALATAALASTSLAVAGSKVSDGHRATRTAHARGDGAGARCVRVGRRRGAVVRETGRCKETHIAHVLKPAATGTVAPSAPAGGSGGSGGSSPYEPARSSESSPRESSPSESPREPAPSGGSGESGGSVPPHESLPSHESPSRESDESSKSPSYGQSLEAAIAPAESLTMAGAEQYIYVGSTAGGRAMEAISWSPDLGVTAAYSGNEAISIGRSGSNTGSYGSAAGNHAIAGVALNGYTVVRTYAAQATATGPGWSGGPETAAPGTSLELPFSTEAGDVVLILVGGEGTGDLQLGGIEAVTLENQTYSEAGSEVIASAAIYAEAMPTGSYTARWSSTTYLTNSGTSLGAVAYVLRPR